MELEGSLPCSPQPEEQVLGPVRVNMLVLQDEFLAVKLEVHRLSAVLICLVSIFLPTLHSWGPSPRSAT